MVSLTLLALLTTPPQSCPLFEIHRTGKELSLVRSEVARVGEVTQSSAEGTATGHASLTPAQEIMGWLLLHDVAVRVGELPVLDKLSAREGAALLGSDLLGRFRRIIIEPEALRARILP